MKKWLFLGGIILIIISGIIICFSGWPDSYRTFLGGNTFVAGLLALAFSLRQESQNGNKPYIPPRTDTF